MRSLTWLRRRLWVRGPDGERGAIAVAVALLFPILLAAAALSVDTAASWMARSQVIAGADAAALAEAMDCAADDCGTKAEVVASMEHYWLRNNDGAKAASLQPGTGWIQWDTGQRATRSQGTWAIKHFFGAAIGVPTSSLTIESMARWTGAPAATADLPLAVSLCAYQRATNSGGVGSTRSTATLSLSTVTTGASCGSPAGGAVTGTTVLTAPGTGCTTASVVGQAVPRAATAPAACTTAYLTGLVGRDVWVAVYDQIGTDTTRVYGYAALRVTSVTTGSPATVTGYYVWSPRQIDTPGTAPTAPDLGARAVFLWDPSTWVGQRCPC